MGDGEWGIGDWGWGIGDWGLGPIPNPQSPIPNPQSPIPLNCLKILIKNTYIKKIILIILLFQKKLFKTKK